MFVEPGGRKAIMNENSGHAPKVMIVAGEASGDLHGALLVREMLAVNPTLHFFGIGGSLHGEERERGKHRPEEGCPSPVTLKRWF